jgi:hypothetical protein
VDLENQKIRKHDFVTCEMPSFTKVVQYYLQYVKVALTKFGNGGIKRVIVGGSPMISGRTSPTLRTLVETSAWDRLMYIASIQAKVWNYTGPYGFGDMDMLGALPLRRL